MFVSWSCKWSSQVVKRTSLELLHLLTASTAIYKKKPHSIFVAADNTYIGIYLHMFI